MLGAEGRHREALDSARASLKATEELGTATTVTVKDTLVQAVESALALSLADEVEELLGRIERARPGERIPFLRAQALRFRAKLAAGADPATEAAFLAAASTLSQIETPFWLAVTLLEHGEWLSAHDRTAEAADRLSEAREIFERLRAQPWLERLSVAEQAAHVSGS